MTMHRGLAAALWLLAGAAALAAAITWAGEAQGGKISAWALVVFFWGAAAVSVAIHYLAQAPDVLRRYWLHRGPIAGSPAGATPEAAPR